MTSKHALLFFTALLAPSSLTLACGSSIEVPGESGGGTTTSTTGSGGTSGTGASTGTGNSGTGGAGNSGTGGTGGFTGGSGGVGGFGGSGGATTCGALTEVDCLGAYPSCMPVYDDACCPSCDPIGNCSDCIDLRFDHCAPATETCAVKPSCGFTPEWACKGGVADCAINPGGSLTPCHKVAGCTAAYCPTNADCAEDPVCHPVTKGMCSAICAQVAPPCAPGLFAESSGSCWTGRCVDASICGFAL